MKRRYAHYVGDNMRILELGGREEWALSNLLAAGPGGCTSIDHPGPRWSDYVFKLRRRGINVETVTETHEGPFAGHHARYVLRDRIERLQSECSPGPADAPSLTVWP
jgi:hypothetical protein